MAVQSHKQETVFRSPGEFAGRPPYDCAPPVRCTMRYSNPDGRQCASYALWLCPELGRCAGHLPVEAIPIVQQRLAAWQELAAETWAHVVATNPLT